MKRFALLFVLLFAVTTSVFGQSAPMQSTTVAQSPTRYDACTPINATAAVANAVTLTITPPNGQFVYLCGLDLTLSNNGTGAVVSTNLTFTSTNFGGWLYKFSSVNAANTNFDKSFYWNIPVKSAQAGTAVTIVSPASNAQAAYSINAYFYFAP